MSNVVIKPDPIFVSSTNVVGLYPSKAFGGGVAFNNENSIRLDGSNEYVSANNLVALVSGTASGTIMVRFRCPVLPGAGRSLICFGDTNGAQNIQVSIQSTGQYQVQCVIGGVAQWRLQTGTSVVLEANRWHTIAFGHNGSQCFTELDGKRIDQSFTASVDLTAWFGDATGLDNCIIGARQFNSGAVEQFLQVDINEVDVYSTYLNEMASVLQYNGNYSQSNVSNSDCVEQILFGDNPLDNYNVDNANAWTFYGSKLSTELLTVNCEEADLIQAAPAGSNKALVIIIGNSLPDQSVNQLRTEMDSAYTLQDIDYYNLAVAGYTQTNIINLVLPAALSLSKGRANDKIVVLNEVRNTLVSGVDTTTCFNQLIQILTNFKNQGFQAACVQVPASADGPSSGVAVAGIVTVNSSIAAYAGSIIDLKIDMYNFGEFDDFTNLTWYNADQIHPSNPFGRQQFSGKLVGDLLVAYPTIS